MASKKIQTVPATRGKSVSASFSSRDSTGVVTRSKAKAISATPHVMVTGAMSIEEQLAHMSEVITKLTKMVEENDAQIASLINKWEVHQDKEPGQDAHKKGPHYEAESSEKGLSHETKLGEKSPEKIDAARKN
ncbi:unnamed protein product [Prunus armeniaca]